MPLSPNEAVQRLQFHTESFLAKYSVTIAGDPSGSQVTSFYIEDAGDSSRPGSILRTRNMHATQRFRIRPAGALGTVTPVFQAHSVKMFKDPPSGVYTYVLPVDTTPDLMVTGQLSGCSFAIRKNADGTLVVAHIQPQAGAGQAIQLQETLKNSGNWDIVYGKGDYAKHLRTVSIVGKRIGQRWHIWAQKQDTDNHFSILKVKKLL